MGHLHKMYMQFETEHLGKEAKQLPRKRSTFPWEQCAALLPDRTCVVSV